MDRELALKRLECIELDSQKIRRYVDRILGQEKKNKPMTEKRLKRIKRKAERIKYFVDELKKQIKEPDIPPPPVKPSKLAVKGNGIFYGNGGTIPIKLIGVYRWEALWRETGEHNCQWDWGKYSLAWYEEELSKYDFNCVRHGGVLDTKFLYEHCKRMKEQGKIVQVTIFRNVDEGILVRLEDMPDLAKLGNVFFDINEFCSAELTPGRADVYRAIEIIEELTEKGCIVSAGSWGASSCGEELSDEFHSRCDKHQIEQHHRRWDKESFLDSLKYGKPAIFDEYFSMGDLSLQDVKDLMRLAIDLGYSGIDYYGFRFEEIPGLKHYDPFDYRKPLEYFEILCKKSNQQY
ncbi:MAG: hypothetical protein ACTSPV_00390 [Candidatus Hodarchaeales archaeon]